MSDDQNLTTSFDSKESKDVPSDEKKPKQDEDEGPTKIKNENSSSTNTGGVVTGWLTSFVQTAKQTVNKTTMDCIKRDLNELKDAVQNDTTNMVYSTASLVKNTFNEIGNSVSEIGSFGSTTNEEIVNNKLVEEPPEPIEIIKQEETVVENNNENNSKTNPLPFRLKTLNSWTSMFADTAKSTISLVKDTLVDSLMANFSTEELEDEPIVVINGQIIKIENWKQLLHEIQSDPDTYCREPSGPLEEDFDKWSLKFDIGNYQEQIDYLMETVPEIKKFYEELVITNKLTMEDFWQRYFYKVDQLKQEQIFQIQQQQQQKHQELNETTTTLKQENISRSSTEDGWDKMSDKSAILNNNLNENNNNNTTKNQKSTTTTTTNMTTTVTSNNDNDSKTSSDDDREWVKCE